MQFFARSSLLALGALCLFACSHGGNQQAEEQKPAVAPDVTGRPEKFTGEIVKRNGEYRFKVLGEDPEKILRLSRTRTPKDFVEEEIHLRKYYGKTIVVQGIMAEDWIAKADIIGQWLRPGETRGSTLTGPEPN
jgi:hypothetical protein